MGIPKEERFSKFDPENPDYDNDEVLIGDNVIISDFCSIYEGVTIGSGTVLEEYSRLGPGSAIGKGSRVCYSANICDCVTIGSQCVIGGFIGDDSIIEDHCRVFGALIHEQTRPHKDWWEVHEKAPVLRRKSFVGWNATIVGPVEIGPFTYILPGAVVRSSVPPRTVVTTAGKFIPISEWKGKGLRELIADWMADS